MANYSVKPGNSLADRHPNLLKEWDYTKNSLSPDEVTRSSAKKAHWKCQTCNYEWFSSVNSRSQGKGCPNCAGMVVIPGVNDFATTQAEYTSWWNSPEISPTQYSAGSEKMVQWKCPKDHTFSRMLKKFNGNCPHCAKRSNSVMAKHPTLIKEWADENELTAELTSYNSAKVVMWKCGKCKHLWKTPVYQRVNQGTGCPKCASSNFTSRAEDNIALWLESELGLTIPDDFTRHNRSLLNGRELDFLFKSRSIAIEFNGLYWHSEFTGKGKTYHYDKWEDCQNSGVQLIQVWEDDWKHRQQVVKNMLMHKLGQAKPSRLSGRKTLVDPSIVTAEARIFLDNNHIQGFVPGSYYLGLRSKVNNSLVALMVLRKTGKPGELVLARYATSCILPGGQSKLLAWVDKSIPYERMVTFADLTVSSGHLYSTTSWTREILLPPDYSYLYRGLRHHKFSFRRARFRDDPELIYEEELSERELAELNGIPRIWDCGKIRYSRSPK